MLSVANHLCWKIKLSEYRFLKKKKTYLKLSTSGLFRNVRVCGLFFNKWVFF